MADNGKKIHIKDNRKVDNITGKKINDMFTGDYDADVIKDFIDSAIEHDIDPYTAVTQALIETKVGKDYNNTSNIAAIDHLPESWQNRVKKETSTKGMSKEELKLADKTKDFLNSFEELKQFVKRDAYFKEERGKDYEKLEEMQTYLDRIPRSADSEFSNPEWLLLNGLSAFKNYSVHPSYKMFEEIASAGIDKAVRAYDRKHRPLAEAMDKFLTLSPGQQYIIAFKDKMDYAERIIGKGKPETAYLQFYQGWTTSAPEAQYGLPKGDDFTKSHPYGKRTVDVRENVIKQNDEIKKMVEEAIKKKMAKKGDLSFIKGYSKPEDAFRSLMS